MKEQEIRERVVKLMTEFADRGDACVKAFRDLRPGRTLRGAWELFDKCHKEVLDSVALEEVITGKL